MDYIQATDETVPLWRCANCQRQVVDIYSPEYLRGIARAFAYFDQHLDAFQKALNDIANKKESEG
jgi:hypothetical protein